jgi:hypothetical protein
MKNVENKPAPLDLDCNPKTDASSHHLEEEKFT